MSDEIYRLGAPDFYNIINDMGIMIQSTVIPDLTNDQYRDFTLSAGIWVYWFKDKETHKPISPRLFIGALIDNKTTIYIEIPTQFQKNETIILQIERAR